MTLEFHVVHSSQQQRTTNNKQRRVEFLCVPPSQINSFVFRLRFSGEATFHLNGKVNRHNVRIWSGIMV